MRIVKKIIWNLKSLLILMGMQERQIKRNSIYTRRILFCLLSFCYWQIYVDGRHWRLRENEKTFLLPSCMYISPPPPFSRFMKFHECNFYLIRQVHRRMGGQQSARSALPASHPGRCPQRSQASPRQESQEPKARINDFAPPSGHHGRIK